MASIQVSAKRYFYSILDNLPNVCDIYFVLILIKPSERRFRKKLGASIASARSAAGWHQEVLAKRIGLTRASITNLERGRQCPSVYTLMRIADALGVDLAAILSEAAK